VFSLSTPHGSWGGARTSLFLKGVTTEQNRGFVILFRFGKEGKKKEGGTLNKEKRETTGLSTKGLGRSTGMKNNPCAR